MMGRYWDGSGFGWFGFLGMGIGMLINLGIIALIVYFLVRFLSKDRITAEASTSIEILKQRYAKGEIDEEEYNKRFEFLKRQP